MGEEGKFNTRRGMRSSAACRIQHSQNIYWQARQKTPGLVRPQRPGATYSYEQKRPSATRVLQTRNARFTTAAYNDACRLLQKRSPIGGKGRQWSCRELLTETT